MSFIILLSVLWGTPYGVEPAGVDAYVHELAQQSLPYPQRVSEVARAGLGTTYHDGPLGEGPDGEYDTDPLIDLSRVDCVTYVEQCLALAAGRDYNDVVAKLQRIRYAGGAVDFSTRNHFLVSDWLQNNAWCIERTGQLGASTETVTRTISKKGFFKRVNAPALGQTTPDRDVSLTYIPVEHVAVAETGIRAPSLVVFIGKIDWLFALHCGIFVPGETGGGKLYHASSKSGAVVAVDLSDYVESQSKRYLGISVHEITAPPFAG